MDKWLEAYDLRKRNEHSCTVAFAYDYYVLECPECAVIGVVGEVKPPRLWESEERKQQEDELARKSKRPRVKQQGTEDIKTRREALGFPAIGCPQGEPLPALQSRKRDAEGARRAQRALQRGNQEEEAEGAGYGPHALNNKRRR